MRFVKVILLLMLSSTHHIAYAKSSSDTDCHKHPIQCAIMTLQPALPGGEAHLLSNYIHKYSLKYNVNPYRVVAIAMQESSLINRHRVNKNNEITDVGIYQFHIGTIKAYNMDMEKLMTDLEYATDRMCWLLSQKKKYCEDLNDEAWTCYHSRTESLRRKYKKQVNNYYMAINN